MVLNVLINALAATSIIADLYRVAVVAKMNAHSLSHVITLDVEDLGITPSNTLRRLFANLVHKS